jgi:vacuolar-type H+-ATPase subunit E/Vma4
MLEQVKALQGKDDIPCDVIIDQNNFLPEWNEEDSKNSCLGGFVIYCKKNRIVCSQTLDDRMSLVFGQAVPDIRRILFPSLTKPPKVNRLDAEAVAAYEAELLAK